MGQTYLKLENVLNTIKLLLEPVEIRHLAIERRKRPARLRWRIFGGNRVWREQSSGRLLRHLFSHSRYATTPRFELVQINSRSNSGTLQKSIFHSSRQAIEVQGMVLPGGELLKGLFSVLASSRHRSGEVGNGRAGHQGLDSRSDRSSADAASDTDEGGHVGREEVV